MHKSTISRIITKVSTSIASLKNEYIKMPRSEAEIKAGALDEALEHVKIKSSGGHNTEAFRKRKGYISINFLAVCDPKLKIITMARFCA